MMDKYILQGTKVVPCEDLMEWARFMEKKERIVKKTELGGLYISTVFLGVDHAFGNSRPLLFETMVFGQNDNAAEIQERCSTWEEALTQHERVCEEVKDNHWWSSFALRNLFR